MNDISDQMKQFELSVEPEENDRSFNIACRGFYAVGVRQRTAVYTYSRIGVNRMPVNDGNTGNEVLEAGSIWVSQTLAAMSLREKIGQTIVQHVEHAFGNNLQEGVTPEQAEEFLQRCPVGGLFIGGEVIRQASGTHEWYGELIGSFQQQSRIPLLVTGDLEAGAGSAVSSLTRLPGMMALGACRDEELAYQAGKYTALEGRMAGFNWNLAPVADLAYQDVNAVVGVRAASDDPAIVGAITAALVAGMQEHGMAACAKHFPGDGVDWIDQHIGTSVNSLPEDEWRATYGAVYREVIAAGVRTIMLGHIALPWLEPWDQEKNRHVPATVSGRIIRLLREDLRFKGVIVTDALNMGGFTGWGDYRTRIIGCVNSGADLLLWPGPAYMDVIGEAVGKGDIQEEVLNRSVARILRLKWELGLVGGAAAVRGQAVEAGTIDSVGKQPKLGGTPEEMREQLKSSVTPEEIAVQARQTGANIAARSITLARNRKGILPFASGQVRHLLVVKARSSSAHPVNHSMDEVIALLRSRGLEITVVEQFDAWNCLDAVREQEQEKSWDACLVLACLRSHLFPYSMRPEGESARALWAMQNADSLDPVYVSMLTPHLLRDVPYADTLIDCYSSDSFTCDMLVKALFGEIPFNRKSPVTMRDTADGQAER